MAGFVWASERTPRLPANAHFPEINGVNQMKTNIYFFVVGILSILFCFTHAFNGQSGFLPMIDGANLEVTTKIAAFYIWHIISIENLVFGIAFLIMAFHKDSKQVRFAAWMVAAVIVARWLVILGSTVMKDAGSVTGTLVDSVAIVIYVGLIVLGIRKKDQQCKQTN